MAAEEGGVVEVLSLSGKVMRVVGVAEFRLEVVGVVSGGVKEEIVGRRGSRRSEAFGRRFHGEVEARLGLRRAGV